MQASGAGMSLQGSSGHHQTPKVLRHMAIKITITLTDAIGYSHHIRARKVGQEVDALAYAIDLKRALNSTRGGLPPVPANLSLRRTVARPASAKAAS
jgi:hypothetical protein